MIRILNANEIPAEEIFSRTIPQAAAADAVSEIIAAVRREGTRRFFSTASALTA